MPDGFSLKEAAAITALPESTLRVAVERKFIAPRAKSVGKATRYAFYVKDLVFIKLLSDFPLDLDRDDKEALRQILFGRASAAGRWQAKGSDFIVTNGSVVLHVELKQLRNKLAHDLAIYRRGRRRIVSDPDILGGEPVFSGTRIPLAHVSGMIARGVDRAEIVEDFPALSESDIDYAAIHAKMKRNPGRPPKPIEIRRRKSTETTERRAPSDR
jgi:uncharacterized protein (DUF433 family)